MKELSYIIVPRWLNNVIQQKYRGDLSVLLDLNSLPRILSDHDVQTYLALQDFDAFKGVEVETKCAGAHLSRLLDGLRKYYYGKPDADSPMAQLSPDAIVMYLKRYSNGYMRACLSGVSGITDPDVEQTADTQPIPHVVLHPVNESVFAVICDAGSEETMNDRVNTNYTEVINYMRSRADLKTVAGFALYSNWIGFSLITHRLRRI